VAIGLVERVGHGLPASLGLQHGDSQISPALVPSPPYINPNVAGQITARAGEGYAKVCLGEISMAYPVNAYNRYILRAV
jgi:hypothetical protein